MAENKGIQNNNSNGVNDEVEEIRRPEGRYDVAIGFIDKFPVRIFTVFALMAVAMHLMTHQHELTYVIPPTPFGAWLLTMAVGIMVFVELITGIIASFVKRLLIMVVMGAEEKAAEL